MMETIRSAIDDDGTWLLVDIKARDTVRRERREEPDGPDDVRRVSVLSCMSSALSEPGGAGPRHARPAGVARRATMTADAGFTRFRRLAIDHPVNAFYEVRP